MKDSNTVRNDYFVRLALFKDILPGYAPCCLIMSLFVCL